MLGYFVERTFKVANRFTKSKSQPLQSQQETLYKLLYEAKDTLFGLHYGFDEIIRSADIIRAFKSRVPTFDYDSIYNEWWHMLLECKGDITWPGRIKRFALSSGTSGAASKYIPVSTQMQKSMRKAGLRMFMSLVNFKLPPTLYSKAMLMIGGTTSLVDKYDYKMGDLSGINGDAPPFWIRGYYKPGTEIAKTKDWHERTKIIVKNAPKWDVGYLTGIPSWVQLTLQEIINYYKLDTIHDLWPNLSVFVSGGISYKPYESSFNKIFGQDVLILDSYLASEGFIAFQNRPDTKSMKLVLDNGIFYEFIPFNDDNFDINGNIRSNATVLGINEVQENIDYALLITTNSGAWRYMIGDTVRFTNAELLEIIISGRTKHFLSVCGEHLSVDNMNSGILHLQEKFQTCISEYTVSAVESPNGFYHQWYIGIDQPVDTADLEKELDRFLCTINDDYATERAANVLQPIQIKTINTALFYKYMDSQGKMTGQTKFPRVLKDAQRTQFEKFVNERIAL